MRWKQNKTPLAVVEPSEEEIRAQREAQEQKVWQEELAFVRGQISKAIAAGNRFVNIYRYNHRHFVSAVVAVANEDKRVKDIKLHSRTETGGDMAGNRYYSEQALLTLEYTDS